MCGLLRKKGEDPAHFRSRFPTDIFVRTALTYIYIRGAESSDGRVRPVSILAGDISLTRPLQCRPSVLHNTPRKTRSNVHSTHPLLHHHRARKTKMPSTTPTKKSTVAILSSGMEKMIQKTQPISRDFGNGSLRSTCPFCALRALSPPRYSAPRQPRPRVTSTSAKKSWSWALPSIYLDSS